MYKVIIDSCGELTEEMKTDGHFMNVPLTLEVDGYHIVDDETFDQADFLKRVDASPLGPHSACPSPESYMKAFEGEEDRVYVVTLSAQLSGSYNSAVLAAGLYKEEHGEDKKIYVFNSKSASIGQTLIGLMVREMEKLGLGFEEVVEKVEAYVAKINTFFVLEKLDTLRKNGRLSNVKAFFAETLNIKPIMGSTDEGSIQQLGTSRGMRKALMKMVDIMLEHTDDTKNRILAIAHCNCPERANFVKERIEQLAEFAGIVIVNTRGVSSMYANEGGVILAV